MKNKIVLITGGAQGIGADLVRHFLTLGAKVAFTYIHNEQRALDLINSFSVDKERVFSCQCDATSRENTQNWIEAVLTKWERIDVLVNNAGITRDGLLLRMSEENWDQVIETNLKSVFNTSQAVLKPMMKQRSGSIISISSVVGLTGNAGQANYAASKSGIIGFSKSLALELAPRNVRVNVIAPGFIETEMTASMPEKHRKMWEERIPLKRVGKPIDVSKCASFLASDDASYITGQVISVNGGLI